MGPEGKREGLELVRRAPVAKQQSLAALGLPRSTYDRWQRRWRQAGDSGLVDRRPAPGTVWNRIRPAEEDAIQTEALR